MQLTFSNVFFTFGSPKDVRIHHNIIERTNERSVNMKSALALSLLSSADSLSTIPDTFSKTSTNYCPDRRNFLGWTVGLIPSCASALTPQEASRQYDTYASSYDDLDGGKVSVALGIEDARREMIQTAKGDVLEIGVGTGKKHTPGRFLRRYIFLLR